MTSTTFRDADEVPRACGQPGRLTRYGVIAAACGPPPTLIALPGLLGAVWMGVTVPEPLSTT